MDTQRVNLEAIVFDAGTQVRAAISEQTVADYAEAMGEGATFPPIVLFHDGNRYYLADGFHRAMASKRVGYVDIDARVEAGTQTDALWYALGANKANGHRMTAADKQHAVEVALAAWPHKMQREIAEQVGCHPSLVSEVARRVAEKYKKSIGSEPVLRGRALATQQKRETVKALIDGGGLHAEEIAKRAQVSRSLVSDVRAELGLSRIDRTKAAIEGRREQMRGMASEGYTSVQIAAAVGLDEQTCRTTLRKEGVDVPGDRATAKAHRHDSNRILEHIVMDAEHLTADVGLIEFKQLDRERLGEWIDSLVKSRKALGTFISRLTEEHKKHGQAA